MPPGRVATASFWQLRPEMQTEDARNAVLFQNPGLADRLGAAGRLLGRLEDQQDVARQRLLRRDEIRQREQHGHMAVVAAGVHPPPSWVEAKGSPVRSQTGSASISLRKATVSLFPKSNHAQTALSHGENTAHGSTASRRRR